MVMINRNVCIIIVCVSHVYYSFPQMTPNEAPGSNRM